MEDLVPTIDVSGSGDATERAVIAHRIDDALRHVGFLQIVGHGLPDDVLAGALRAVDAFFALAVADKCRLVPASPLINRGYAPLGAESLSYSLGIASPPDQFEAFNVGPHDVDRDDPRFAPERDGAFAENLWPSGLPAFRTAITRYFIAARAVAHRLTGLFAAALDVEPDTFAAITDHSTDMLRMLHYERTADQPATVEGQMRLGAHTDYGLCTVLYADPVEGLEIVGSDGAWHPVMPAPGALLVNIGDLLAEMTNDRWRSTIHRVAPPRAAGAVRRRSMAFFHDGDFDARIEVLPSCHDAENPPKYAPVIAGEHLRAKIAGPRTLRASAATSTVGDRMV